MVKNIIQRAISEILAEREIKIQEECAKVEKEMISPKFVEFDNNCQNAIAKENQRHNIEIDKITQDNEMSKTEYATRIRNSIEAIIENKYHYNALIKELNKLQGE